MRQITINLFQFQTNVNVKMATSLTGVSVLYVQLLHAKHAILMAAHSVMMELSLLRVVPVNAPPVYTQTPLQPVVNNAV